MAGQVEDFGAYSADCPPSEEGGACTPRPLRKGDQGSCLLDSPAPGAAGREGWDMRGGEGQGQVHTAALVGSREWKGRRWWSTTMWWEVELWFGRRGGSAYVL